MTEKGNNLLAVFEERIQDLLKLCDERRLYIEEMEKSLKEKEDTILQTKQIFEALQTKYTNLLTANIISEDEEVFRNARKRVNELVREVDACIALLNE